LFFITLSIAGGAVKYLCNARPGGTAARLADSGAAARAADGAAADGGAAARAAGGAAARAAGGAAAKSADEAADEAAANLFSFPFALLAFALGGPLLPGGASLLPGGSPGGSLGGLPGGSPEGLSPI